MPVSQPDALSPNVIGTACWVRVRPAMTVCRWVSASAATVATWAGELLLQPVEHVAGAEHQGGVDDVLAGQAAVQPAGRLRVRRAHPVA